MNRTPADAVRHDPGRILAVVRVQRIHPARAACQARGRQTVPVVRLDSGGGAQGGALAHNCKRRNGGSMNIHGVAGQAYPTSSFEDTDGSHFDPVGIDQRSHHALPGCAERRDLTRAERGRLARLALTIGEESVIVVE